MDKVLLLWQQIVTFWPFGQIVIVYISLCPKHKSLIDGVLVRWWCYQQVLQDF